MPIFSSMNPSQHGALSHPLDDDEADRLALESALDRLPKSESLGVLRQQVAEFLRRYRNTPVEEIPLQAKLDFVAAQSAERRLLRRAGLRQIWVPDPGAPGFADEVRRQMRVIHDSEAEAAETEAWFETSDKTGWTA
jgi:hypothetical protein